MKLEGSRTGRNVLLENHQKSKGFPTRAFSERVFSRFGGCPSKINSHCQLNYGFLEANTKNLVAIVPRQARLWLRCTRVGTILDKRQPELRHLPLVPLSEKQRRCASASPFTGCIATALCISNTSVRNR